MKLAGTHVVVTGASRGVGEQLARAAAARGATVTALARSEGPLRTLADETGARPVVVDLADIAALDGIVARIESDAGPVDVLLNNAAVGQPGPFAAQTAERMARHLQTNLHAPLELTRQVLPGMLERGRGTIAAVSSISGELAFRNVATYSASKAGLSQFVVDLRRELRRSPVRTLLVILGEVETQMIQEGRGDPVLAAVARRLSKLKSLDPADVAAATLDAVERGRGTLVMPPLLRPAYAMRQLPNRFTDLAMAGIE